MYAVIRTGGKQYRVAQGDVLRIEKVRGDKGAEVKFDEVVACYEEQVLKWLADPNREGGPKGEIGFTISADMSLELRAVCVRVPQTSWQLVEERVGETVHCAEVEFTPGNWDIPQTVRVSA